jgi:hypothetical protein
MSYSATVARVDPAREITSDEWVQFARRHPQLILEATDVPAATARHTDGPKNLRIFWSNGCISCGAPTPAIIRIVFEFAAELKAAVLSPRGHRYTSVDDWEKKTREARKRSADIHKSSQIYQKRERWLLAAKLLGGVVAGCLIYWALRGGQ